MASLPSVDQDRMMLLGDFSWNWCFFPRIGALSSFWCFDIVGFGWVMEEHLACREPAQVTKEIVFGGWMNFTLSGVTPEKTVKN